MHNDEIACFAAYAMDGTMTWEEFVRAAGYVYRISESIADGWQRRGSWVSLSDEKYKENFGH